MYFWPYKTSLTTVFMQLPHLLCGSNIKKWLPVLGLSLLQNVTETLALSMNNTFFLASDFEIVGKLLVFLFLLHTSVASEQQHNQDLRKKNTTEKGVGVLIHHFLPEFIAFNQSVLYHFLPECIVPWTTWGCCIAVGESQ